MGRIALVQGGAQRPFIDLGRGEQLVEWSRQREGRAARVDAGRDGRPDLVGPAQPRPRILDAATPALEEIGIGLDADDFEDCPRGGEIQVVAGQAPRVLERQ